MVLLKSSTALTSSKALNSSTFHYGSIKIRLEDGRYAITAQSTFHYGSIKMLTQERLKLNLKKSTFHYGSIKIIYHHWRELFQFQIYIPLWFY